MAWQQEHNEKVAAIIAALTQARVALRAASLAAFQIPENVSARNVRDWCEDTAGEIQVELEVVRRMLV